jgi:hypothetical protein
MSIPIKALFFYNIIYKVYFVQPEKKTRLARSIQIIQRNELSLKIRTVNSMIANFSDIFHVALHVFKMNTQYISIDRRNHDFICGIFDHPDISSVYF